MKVKCNPHTDTHENTNTHAHTHSGFEQNVWICQSTHRGAFTEECKRQKCGWVFPQQQQKKSTSLKFNSFFRKMDKRFEMLEFNTKLTFVRPCFMLASFWEIKWDAGLSYQNKINLMFKYCNLWFSSLFMVTEMGKEAK